MKKPNKRQILQRVLDIPKQNKRAFWSREMKLLNDLLKKFEDIEFWAKVNFKPRPNSLLYFKTQPGLLVLQKKYNEFSYKIPDKKVVSIGKKEGQDRLYSRKPKTTKDFLNQ